MNNLSICYCGLIYNHRPRPKPEVRGLRPGITEKGSMIVTHQTFVTDHRVSHKYTVL